MAETGQSYWLALLFTAGGLLIAYAFYAFMIVFTWFGVPVLILLDTILKKISSYLGCKNI